MRSSTKFYKGVRRHKRFDGDRVMLVTLWWWEIYEIGDRIIMMATFFIMLGIFSPWNQSRKSEIGHQYPKVVINTFLLQHLSPTSMKPGSSFFNFKNTTFKNYWKLIFTKKCYFVDILTKSPFHPLLRRLDKIDPLVSDSMLRHMPEWNQNEITIDTTEHVF